MKYKNINMKVFKNNLKVNSKTTLLKSKTDSIGSIKYLPSFSKEWRNIVYSFNKNNLKNIPSNDININKIVQSYFDLFFKKELGIDNKNIPLRKRRKFLRRIFISNVEIKHTNTKAKITLFTINREEEVFMEKYANLYTKISFKLFKDSIFFYRKFLNKEFIKNILNQKYQTRNEYFFESEFIGKKNYLKHKLNYFQIFLKLKNLWVRKMWSLLIQKQSKKYLILLRKFNLLYSLNEFKFNKLILLPKLSNLLSKLMGKKLEYNIINLKSISYNADIFTKILALKINKIKKGNHVDSMLSVINHAYLPAANTLQERTKVQNWNNFDSFQNSYKDLKIISNIKDNQKNVSELLTTVHKGADNSNKIHNLIYNSINYKNMSGIKIEVKGRLTKRYRADRSVYSLKHKGGLKNISSSFQGLSSVLFRGNTKSNISYSWTKSKRRVGAFAVKGWIGGK
jgi:hypothetical protein